MYNTSKKTTPEQYVEDYNKCSNLETLDSKFADARNKIKAMFPIDSDEYISITDFQITETCVISCCTIKLDIDINEADFFEIDKEQETFITKSMKSEQMKIMMKYCECTGRDLRYVYCSKSGNKVHEQVFKPTDYLIHSQY